MKLISMTKFVLQDIQDSLDKDAADIHRDYARFLDQPLTLGMFVPCKKVNGVWVVLEKPECSLGNKCASPPCVEYQEAKYRVLFEGFEIKDHKNHKTIKLKDADFNVFWNKGCELGWYLSIGIKTIEDISKYNLQLTETAQKQIGYEQVLF